MVDHSLQRALLRLAGFKSFDLLAQGFLLLAKGCEVVDFELDGGSGHFYDV